MNARVKKIQMVAIAAGPHASIMNDEIHHRALAAAVRLSLTCASLALVPACDPKPRETTAPVAPATHAKPSPSVEPNRVPDGATITASEEYGRPKVDPLPATMTCEERLDSALPKSGDAVAGSQEVAKRTKAVVNCCMDVIKTEAWGNEHFWDCCNVVRGQLPEAEIPQSCSPWGPAVPPSIGWSPERGIA